ncbi:MAG: beta-galactosidase trimerization domain-containing protein [Candidatus Sumerlaeota bacterium]|nr:beta-galactosidase trimerization domain-containing protein [Candidatus Sumerlaeota bacterium]
MSSSVGDQLHPRGRLDKAAYGLIGNVYRYIESCEPWVEDGRIVSQIAVIIDPEAGDHPGPCGLGVIRALQQLQQQFDLLPPSANFENYELVIAPENIRMDKALAKKLSQYLKSGGALLVSGGAALATDNKPALPELGIESAGASPYTTTYLRLDGAIAKGITDTDHVMYEPGFRMTPAKSAKGAKVLCRVVEPYFERAYNHFCSHRQTPPDKLSRWAAIVQNGQAITFSVPIFTAYGSHGNIPYRQILAACIERLLPRPLIRCEGPAHLETSVLRKGRSVIAHLISYCPARRVENLDIVEEPFPLVDMPLAVRFSAKPRRIILAPSGKELPFDYKDGYARLRVTVPDGHAMVVVESRL